MGLPDIDNIPDSGAVFTIGRSRFADNVASHFFIRKDPVVSVTCGDEHSAVVCQSGRLFVFGSNDWGQLGLGHKNHVSKPSCVKVLKPEKVTHVACGRAHTLICTAEQKIFACGCDQESQLGRGSQSVGDSSSSPILVHDCGILGPKVVEIAAGSHHSLALTNDGCVLAWGSNLEGQLGLPGTSGLVNKPTKVHLPEPVKQISAGYYHSAFLTESGSVYVCGEAESGKLGIALDFRTQVAPKQMELSVTAQIVACGGHHTLILGEDGNIYCTGSNASGQLGMGSDVTEIATPKLLPRGDLENESIQKIGCGESHVAIVTESGKLFTCGDGRHGKLGLEENENNVHELTLASKYNELVVTNVSCGGCHTILVGRKREMVNDDAINEDQQQDLSQQPEQLTQKKNPLPPLKIPLARISRENSMDEKNSESLLDNDNKNDNEETSPHREEESLENTLNGLYSMNHIDKPESPKKLSDYGEVNSIKSNKTEEETGESKDIIENNNETEMARGNLDAENNISMKNIVEPEIAEKVTDAEAVENAMESEGTAENVTEPEVTTKPRSSGSVASRKSGVSMRQDREKSASSSSSSNKEMHQELEKPNSPPLPVPPPKPPRQKIGSADNSESSRSGSTSSRVGSSASCKNNVERIEDRINSGKSEKIEKTNDSVDNQNSEGNELLPEVSKVTAEEEIENIKNKSEKGSAKLSVGSEKSKSANSKAETDETAVVDEHRNIDDGEDNGMIKEKTEAGTDDAEDVVHSPPPKTGKMAKLFKAKKQEVENGTKASSTTNTKAKSKTCTIL